MVSRLRGGGAGKEAIPSFFESLYTSLKADASQIEDGIYLGAHGAGDDRKAMQKKRISHVLICHPTLKECLVGEQTVLYFAEQHAQHFKYGRTPLADDPTANILELLPAALQFLGAARQEKGRIFVCCAKGISRSSSVVIALLMLERAISFEEAFKLCEQRRPVVYPNIGFQQQLKHLEKMLSLLSPTASFWERLKHIRSGVPTGSLDGLAAPMRIRDSIGSSMGAELDDVEALAERVFSQPQLLQQRELWKRHGLFFENFHKYKTLPSDSALLGRAKAVMERLRALPKIFSESLKGVQLALAVAQEIESWAKFAQPLLEGESSFSAALPSAVAPSPVVEATEAETASDGASSTASDEGDRNSEKQAKSKRKRKDERNGKDKLSKKEEKRRKKQKKLDKKTAKAAKKAEKLAARIESAAIEAEKAADASREEAERAAERAAAIEKELALAETEDARKASHARGKKRSTRMESDESSGSSRAHGARPRGNALPARRPAIEAYDDLA